MRKRTLPLVAAARGLAAAAAVALPGRPPHATRHRSSVDPRADDASVFDLEATGVTHHRIPSHDGGELHLVEKGDADARPLVLLHGITLQARIWGYAPGHVRPVPGDRRRPAGPGGWPRRHQEGYRLPCWPATSAPCSSSSTSTPSSPIPRWAAWRLMRFCAEPRRRLDEHGSPAACSSPPPSPPVPGGGAAGRTRRVTPRLLALGEWRGWDPVPGHNNAFN